VIDLEIPRKLEALVQQARVVADNVLRPISRKYDAAEHAYPKELDFLAALIDGINAGGHGASANRLSRSASAANLGAALGMMELARGDVGLALTIPRQGLGNAALAAVGTDEQKQRFANAWIAMAITEPGAGSDSAAIRTTARRDGDDWVLDGEKIFVTAGERATAVVVWATLDPALGRAAIKPFIVPKGTPGMTVVRLDKKLGIRASDTATIVFEGCRIPEANILGSAEIDTKKAFAGVMKTFDNTRPIVAEAGLDDDELLRLEAEWETARLLTLKAAWMADNARPNSLEASMAKAKAARVANEITLRCVELVGPRAYAEGELLEKWARDSKILDIFEGTQQIQMLVVARGVLGKTSAELR
jgi:acyl-CoA dehydrogenase